jgi:asparagine synthase (glutamine-hydrolysing)
MKSWASSSNALQETVRYHLISDVPVGAFLSGGIDSSLIVGMMSKFVDKSFATFTGDVPYKHFSEIHYARMVSERYGTQHHELRIMPSVARILPQLIWNMDEPSDTLPVCIYYLSELVKKKVKVVLGGDGGDELFAGYDRYHGNLLASYYAMIPKYIRKNVFGKLIELFPEGFWYRSVSHQLKWMHQISFYEAGERYANSLSYAYFSEKYREHLYTEKFRKSVELFDPAACIRYYFDSNNAKEIVDKMLYMDCMTRMPDHPNMVLDRMTMAHGLEARSPFLDHKLSEFCAGIPPKYKIRGNKRRYIQVELAKKISVPCSYKKKKAGFQLSFAICDS